MTTFAWQGEDHAGRTRSGELEAPRLAVARALLRRQGIRAAAIRRRRPGGGRGRVRTADIALFSRQLATMMRAGVPLVQAFDIVGSGLNNARLARIVRSVRDRLAAGSALSSALGAHPKQFDELFRNLVLVGEQSGTLDSILERIAAWQEGGETMRRKVKSAMTYPLVVVLAAVVVASVLLIYVVPQFQSVFASAGAELPAFTRFVVSLSQGLRAWWPALLGGIGAVAAVVALLRRHPHARRHWDRLVLRLPIAGRIIAHAAVARYARTLGTTTAAGVPLADALQTLSGVAGNAVHAQAVRDIREAVVAGRALHVAMRATGVFPDLLVQMVAVGEEAGRLDDMLGRAADHFESLVNDTVGNLATLMEPLLLAVLGVLVGGLIVAMYLPVFQLGQVFG